MNQGAATLRSAVLGDRLAELPRLLQGPAEDAMGGGVVRVQLQGLLRLLDRLVNESHRLVDLTLGAVKAPGAIDSLCRHKRRRRRLRKLTEARCTLQPITRRWCGSGGRLKEKQTIGRGRHRRVDRRRVHIGPTHLAA